MFALASTIDYLTMSDLLLIVVENFVGNSSPELWINFNYWAKAELWFVMMHCHTNGSAGDQNKVETLPEAEFLRYRVVKPRVARLLELITQNICAYIYLHFNACKYGR